MLDKHAAPLMNALSPVTWLCITDATDGHAVEGFADGRALSAEGLEALILVVSSRFERKSLIQRQRMVNTVLRDDLTDGSLHSVRMKCLTPAQWEGAGRPPSLRPGAPCTVHVSAGRNEAPPTIQDNDSGEAKCESKCEFC